MSAPESVAEADALAVELLRFCEARGIPAVFLMLGEGALYVRCQNAGDVVPLCKRVVEEHEAPSDRTLQ